MATSSIFNSIHIQDEESASRLLDAIEKSIKFYEDSEINTCSNVQHEISTEESLNLYIQIIN